MTSKDFIDLVRAMRNAQKAYLEINGNINPINKEQALGAVKLLEKWVDEADIDDIANLVTDSPIL